jgi:hypothetical protein
LEAAVGAMVEALQLSAATKTNAVAGCAPKPNKNKTRQNVKIFVFIDSPH